jgi:diketogulonate reductase-like aldo/keto reductase
MLNVYYRYKPFFPLIKVTFCISFTSVLLIIIFSHFQVSSLTNPRLRTSTIALPILHSLLANHTSLKMSSSTLKRARIPEILYGTAWKKDKTQTFVELAIRTGFRGIDTACQPKHYYEKDVGDALAKLYAENIITRQDIFLQTKFTSLRGQDPSNIPYDRTKPLIDQVKQSFQKSLENLQTEYLDSLVMHSPMDTIEESILVWKTFESFYKAGQVHYLGLSNTYNLRVLQAIYEAAEIKPSFLQNRFYRDTNFDVQIREFCHQHNIIYQSFWTLTANPDIIRR